mmetsp:Transcript_29030/g.72394  ORF Transcript_29030/g.72394 Transcript_29030/m.72394 type:complete len:332 (-) Transcript_29030:698-1693(-)
MGHPYGRLVEVLVELWSRHIMPSHVAHNLAQQRVTRLHHAIHHFVHEFCVAHNLRCSGVRRQIHCHRHQIPADFLLWEVDDQLQQHRDGVVVVSEQRFAPVVLRQLRQHTQRHLSVSWFLEQVGEYLQHTTTTTSRPLNEFHAHIGVECQVVEQPTRQQQHKGGGLCASPNTRHQPQQLRQHTSSAHFVFVLADDGHLLQIRQGDHGELHMRPRRSVQHGHQTAYEGVVCHQLPLHTDVLTEVQEGQDGGVHQTGLPPLHTAEPTLFQFQRLLFVIVCHVLGGVDDSLTLLAQLLQPHQPPLVLVLEQTHCRLGHLVCVEERMEVGEVAHD